MPTKQEYQNLFKSLLSNSENYRNDHKHNQTRFMNAISMLYILMGESSQSVISQRTTKLERNIAAHAHAQASSSGEDNNFSGFIEYMQDYLERQESVDAHANSGQSSSIPDRLTNIDAIELMLDVLQLIPTAETFVQIVSGSMDDVENRVKALDLHYALLRLGELPYITVDKAGHPLEQAQLRFATAIENPETDNFFQLLRYFRQLRHGIAHNRNDLALSAKLLDEHETILTNLSSLKSELAKLLLSGAIIGKTPLTIQSNRFEPLAEDDQPIEQEEQERNLEEEKRYWDSHRRVILDGYIILMLNEQNILGGKESLAMLQKKIECSFQDKAIVVFCLALSQNLADDPDTDPRTLLETFSNMLAIGINAPLILDLLRASHLFTFPGSFFDSLLTFLPAERREDFYQAFIDSMLNTPCDGQRKVMVNWALMKFNTNNRLIHDFHRYLTANVLNYSKEDQKLDHLFKMIAVIEAKHTFEEPSFILLFMHNHEALLKWVKHPSFNPKDTHMNIMPYFHMVAYPGHALFYKKPSYNSRKTKALFNAFLAREDLDPNICDDQKHPLLSRLVLGGIRAQDHSLLLERLELLLDNQRVNLNPKIPFLSRKDLKRGRKIYESSKNSSSKQITLAFTLVYFAVDQSDGHYDPNAIIRFARLTDSIITKVQLEDSTPHDKKVLTTFVTDTVSMVIKGAGLDDRPFSIENAAHSTQFKRKFPDHHEVFFRATVAYYQAELRTLNKLLAPSDVPLPAMLQTGYKTKHKEFNKKLSSLTNRFPDIELFAEEAPVIEAGGSGSVPGR